MLSICSDIHGRRSVSTQQDTVNHSPPEEILKAEVNSKHMYQADRDVTCSNDTQEVILAL